MELFNNQENYETSKDFLSDMDIFDSPFKDGSCMSIIIEFAMKSVQVKLHMN